MFCGEWIALAELLQGVGMLVKSLGRMHSEGEGWSDWSLGGCGWGGDEAAVSQDQLQW